MREILFKAKRINDEAWVEGYYVKSYYMNKGKTTCYIIGAESSYVDYEGFYPEDEVDPDTVCQYTGLTDRNGKKIFENDIVEDDIVNYDYTPHKVVFENRFGSACFGIVINDRNKVLNFCSLVPADKMVVIGNIFDNPELIGGVEK